MLGDARLALEAAAPASFDVLVIDAFSSDAIPLHLITDEAIGAYMRVIAKDGLLVLHISNRYIELGPILAAAARHRRLAAALRDDNPADRRMLTGSTWIVMARDANRIEALEQTRPDAPWTDPGTPAPHIWTDDYASILPYIRWDRLLRSQ